MAPRAGRRRLPDLGPRGEGWVLGQFVILLLLVAVGYPNLVAAAPLGTLDWLEITVGAAGLAAAAGVVLAGFRDLGPNLTPMPRPRDDAVLVEGGIYAHVRHPIYAGLILGAFGWCAVTRSLPDIGVALLLAIYLDQKSRREEAWLADRYPEYGAYRARTRHFVRGIY